jgi:hypothetical protein
MLYVLLPRERGLQTWGDIRIFTTFAAAEDLVTPLTYIVAFGGTPELKPVWIYQLDQGQPYRYLV